MNTDKLQSAVSMLTGALILGIGFFIGAIAQLDLIKVDTLEWGKILLSIVALLISGLGVDALYSIATGQREQRNKHQAQQLETQKKLLYYELVWNEFKTFKNQWINTFIPKYGLNIMPDYSIENYNNIIIKTEEMTKAFNENYNLLLSLKNSFANFVDEDKYGLAIGSAITLANEFYLLVSLNNNQYITEYQSEACPLYDHFVTAHTLYSMHLDEVLKEIENSIMKLE